MNPSDLPAEGRTESLTAQAPTANPGKGVRPKGVIDGLRVGVSSTQAHDYVWHVTSKFGAKLLPPGQQSASGYKQTGPNQYEAQSAITALRPVVEQGIYDVLRGNSSLRGVELERRIAQRLTQLNDWQNLNPRTQRLIEEATGVDWLFGVLPDQREAWINHLLHSPLPFGDLDVVLPPEGRINLNYTHTLDKNYTQVAHVGDGVFKVWMISNNNNGSHTGHIMGSFMVQLTPDTSISEARRIGNSMIRNQNKNNQLYLDEAAKRILYGETPLLD